MTPGERQGYRRFTIRSFEEEMGLAQIPFKTELARHDISRGLDPEGDHSDVGPPFTHPYDPRVIGVEYCTASGLDPVNHFTLRARDRLLRPEEFKMSGPDVADNSYGRRREVDQSRDLAERTHPHFEHRKIEIARFHTSGDHASHSQRQSVTGIEVSVGFEHAPGIAQDQGSEVFDRRLSGAPGNPDNRAVPGGDHAGGHLLERANRVFNENQSSRIATNILRIHYPNQPFMNDQCATGSFLEYLANVSVAIDMLTRDRNKQFPGFDFARIDRKSFRLSPSRQFIEVLAGATQTCDLL